MRIKFSGRTEGSTAAIQQLVNFLEGFGEVKETDENILVVDNRECILVAYSSQAYYERKGYYWFSLAKTKFARMLRWDESHAWMILLCGEHGRYFIPLGQIKALLSQKPSNRRDGRWDLYIRLESGKAYFGVTEIKNHLDVTGQLHHFEQIWENPAVEEEYMDDAIYIPDSLPEPDRKTGKVVRVVRDTVQSRFVKELYSYKCQMCGWTIWAPHLKSSWYCEAHHVQPLAKKYGGPDHMSNIIALCPTHHCMMDLGVLAIIPSSLEIVAISKEQHSKGQRLSVRREHGLNRKYLQFHLDHIYLAGYGITEIQLSKADQEI